MSQEALRAANKQLKAQKEELQRLNEEIQAREEELACANEELQSQQEELQTANEELQAQQEELQTANDELAAANEGLDASRMLEQERAQELATVLDAVPAVVFITHDRKAREMTGSRATRELLRQPKEANLSKSAPAAEAPANFRVVKDGFDYRCGIPPSSLRSALDRPRA